MNATHETTDVMTMLTGSFVGMLILAFLILLALATLLMPLYVVSMAGEIKRLRKLMEKHLWHQEKINQELQKIRVRWEA